MAARESADEVRNPRRLIVDMVISVIRTEYFVFAGVSVVDCVKALEALAKALLAAVDIAAIHFDWCFCSAWVQEP